jgi:SagB-type dehydrogenase family enzyme
MALRMGFDSSSVVLVYHSPGLLTIALLLTACAPPLFSLAPDAPAPAAQPSDAPSTVNLPAPSVQGRMSLEETLAQRRSVRQFVDRPLTPAELGQLLWAAQGVTHPAGLRTAPSAGARYPLETYVVLPEGVYHYQPQEHRLDLHLAGDQRAALHAVTLRQDAVLQAPAVIVIAAVYGRTAERYGVERTPRYVHMEVGHAAQNVLLQAVALGLGAVPVGAFHDRDVQQTLALPADQEPLYLIPVGAPLED